MLAKLKFVFVGLLIAIAAYTGISAVKAQTPVEETNSTIDISHFDFTALIENIDPTGTPSYFLKIDGIEGESTDDNHKNEIDILAFSWGESNPGANAGGGGGAGKVSMQDFHFVMQYNKASPKLLLSCANGQHFPKAILTLRKAGGEQPEYLRYTLTDVMCKSYNTRGENPELPIDSFSLGFGKIEVEYKQQKPDGSLAAPIKAGWDLKQNKSI